MCVFERVRPTQVYVRMCAVPVPVVLSFAVDDDCCLLLYKVLPVFVHLRSCPLLSSFNGLLMYSTVEEYLKIPKNLSITQTKNLFK